MPDRDGFMTAAETHAEAVAAEAALIARRGPYELAGEPTAEEVKQMAAADSRHALAAAAFGAAVRAVVKAREAVAEPWKGEAPAEAEAIADAERAQVRASRDEEDALLARNRTAAAISAAGAARRAAVR